MRGTTGNAKQARRMADNVIRTREGITYKLFVDSEQSLEECHGIVRGIQQAFSALRCADRATKSVDEKYKRRTITTDRTPIGMSVYDDVACNIFKLENNTGWAIRFAPAIQAQHKFVAEADSGAEVEGFGVQGRLARLLDLASSKMGFQTMSAEDIQFLRENFGPLEALGDIREVREKRNGEIVVVKQAQFSPHKTWAEYIAAEENWITQLINNEPAPKPVPEPIEIAEPTTNPQPTTPQAIPLYVNNMEDFADYQGIDPEAYGDFS
jgi:hypothetical protein